ncbi:phytanoyl-CoA dioxygenase family protein [bacterium AH-315-E10]|nr:phytanoyl-CoA dioxygenase family protein [bacterium AH-315-E10]
MNDYLLDDIEMATFIVNGYYLIQLDDVPGLHKKIAAAFGNLDRNPGDDVANEISELQEIMTHPKLTGPLRSILGDAFEFNAHRHWHCKKPGAGYMHWHQDSVNNRDHSIKRCLALYYPEDVTADMGPTMIVPGTHYRNAPTDRMAHYYNIIGQIPLIVKAGTIAITHYDLWHGTAPNTSDKKRHMMKFLVNRTASNSTPTWNHDPAWDDNDLDWNHEKKSVKQVLTFSNPLDVSQSDLYKERKLRNKSWHELLGESE